MEEAKNIFCYGEEEISYLKSRDKHLAWAIDQIGPVERSVNPDLFSALIDSIVGQQISTKAAITVWERMVEAIGEITPQAIYNCSEEELQKHGMTFSKARYIRGAAESVLEGRLDLDALQEMSDDEVSAELCKLNGVGVWTAEMLMIFSLQRPNIVSYGDLAILRGMRMLYHHRKITRPLFEKYKRRYAPYGSTASLYLWAIAGGAIPGMKDYAPKVVKKK